MRRPVTRNFDVFISSDTVALWCCPEIRLNKLLNEQSSCQRKWRHCKRGKGEGQSAYYAYFAQPLVTFDSLFNEQYNFDTVRSRYIAVSFHWRRTSTIYPIARLWRQGMGTGESFVSAQSDLSFAILMIVLCAIYRESIVLFAQVDFKPKLFIFKEMCLMGTALVSHRCDVMMSAVAPRITGISIVYSTFCSGVDQRKYQSSASLAFVREFSGDRWIPRTKGQ